MTAARALLLLAAAVVAGGCSQPWPEEGTPVVMLYQQRCGGCHVAYRPGLLTAQMWQAMVDRMEVEIRRHGGALEPAEKAEILAYLQRNAGTR